MRLLERINSPIAFALALVLFLVLDGFLFYRYQQVLQSTDDEVVANAPVEDASASLKDESTVTEETTPSPKEEEEQEGQGKNEPAQNEPAQNEPAPISDPNPDAPIPDIPSAPAVPRPSSGADCSTGGKDVPVVPGTKGDEDVDGIACESSLP